MGYGDNLMASGMARGARERGEVVAFGDGHRVIWDHNSETIFRDNPNVLRPEGRGIPPNARWIPFYKGNRLYNRQDSANDRWIWNYDFRPMPGELFFSEEEDAFAAASPKGVVVIEPNVAEKRSAPNKLWPTERYQAVCDALKRDGYQVAQFQYAGIRYGLSKVVQLKVKGFRQAIAILRNVRLVITAEGGLHHAAAAVGRPAVVLFGGFIPAQVTGYDFHENIAVGEACGKYVSCEHCKQAMREISVEEVYVRATKLLAPAAAVA